MMIHHVTVLVVEGKLTDQQFNTNQLIATCVISTFIEWNLHSNLTSMSPVIMLGPSTLQICLYDCVQDVLLLSNKVEWVMCNEDGNPHIIHAGLALLWMTIHHR